MALNDITERFLNTVSWLINEKIVQDKKDLAVNLGISTSLMTEITKGRSNIGVVPIQNIVVKYNISAEWLLTGNGSMLKTPTTSEPPCNPVVTPLEDGEKGSMLDTINTQAHIIKDLTAKIATLESRLGQNEA